MQKSGQFQVIFVSGRDFLYPCPISIWIPALIKKINNVNVPPDGIQKKYPFEVIIDTVKEIRASVRQVVCASQNLSYDYLVLAETQNGAKKYYQEPPNILCVMDTCNGAAFVFRNTKTSSIIPMPFFGHWIKRSWGTTAKVSKVVIFRHFSTVLNQLV